MVTPAVRGVKVASGGREGGVVIDRARSQEQGGEDGGRGGNDPRRPHPCYIQFLRPGPSLQHKNRPPSFSPSPRWGEGSSVLLPSPPTPLPSGARGERESAGPYLSGPAPLASAPGGAGGDEGA